MFFKLCRSGFASFPTAHRLHHTLVKRQAPQFTAKALVNGEFKQIKSNDLLGKYWVLFFYPLDLYYQYGTFVCPTEIVAFNDRLEDFKRAGCEVLAASVDSEYSHLAWTKVPRTAGGLGPIKLPILADMTKQISRDYGVLVEESGFALRGLFIIDQKGLIRHATINDTAIGRSVEETLRILKAIQHVDQHGQVCPANWTPDQPAIDPSNAANYFSTRDSQKKP